MVKLIPGRRGSGKTKILIDAIIAAKAESKGNVVAIQVGHSLDTQIKHDVRLINIEDYKISSCKAMYGFVGGILASDYDCTHIFIDGILTIVGRDLDELGKMFETIASISSADTTIVFTISVDVGDVPDSVKKFF